MYIPANAYKRMDMENITEPSLSLSLSFQRLLKLSSSRLFLKKKGERRAVSNFQVFVGVAHNISASHFGYP